MIKLSEESSNFKIYYSNNKPISTQILFSDDNKSLINVRKVYTNKQYFGVKFSTIFHKDKTIIHEFRCKDRGFTEELVDNKDRFLEEYHKRLKSTSEKQIRMKNTYTSRKVNFHKEHDLTFYYDSNNNYRFSSISYDNSTFRGLYGEYDKEEYEARIKEHGYAVFCREPTLEEVSIHLINSATVSYSNLISEINTEYSDIRFEMF